MYDYLVITSFAMHKNIFPRSYPYRQIVEAKLYMETEYHNKIDLELIAKHACLSKFHFHRSFKECYGKTPLEYLTFLRLRKAKMLLIQGRSTRATCHLVGFQSVSSFIKLFTRKLKLTPTAYARKAAQYKCKIKSEPLNYVPSGFAVYLGWEN